MNSNIESNNLNTYIEVTEEDFKGNTDDLVSQLIENKGGWFYMLTCLKGYLEFGITKLKDATVK